MNTEEKHNKSKINEGANDGVRIPSILYKCIYGKVFTQSDILDKRA